MSEIPVGILLVEDRYFARLDLRGVVDSRDDMEVVAETAGGEEALRLYREDRPEVVVMDVRLPGRSGLDAIRAINADARVVVLSNYEGSEDVHRALKAGALGHLTKDAGADDLMRRSCPFGRATAIFPAAPPVT